MKKIYLIENAIKDVLLIITIICMYKVQLPFFLLVHPISYDSILTTVNIIFVAALTACFAFTYTRFDLENFIERMLGHIATFLAMLCVGLLLETSVIVLSLKLGMKAWYFLFIVVLFYIALLIYDFWDLIRDAKRH